MKKNLAATLLLAVATCCGCGTTVNWKFLPRETPRMTVARFQGALLYGPASDSYESLSKATHGEISYIEWKYLVPWFKDPETGVPVVEAMANAEIEACYETGDNTAEAIAYYDKVKQGYTVMLVLEDGEWKIGLLETFMPEKAREFHERQQERKAPEP